MLTERARIAAGRISNAGDPVDRALAATIRNGIAASGFAFVGGIAVAVTIGSADLRLGGGTGNDRGEARQHEQREPVGEEPAGHRGELVHTRSAPPRRTVCIITAASGKSSRQPQGETISSPGPTGQTFSAVQAW